MIDPLSAIGLASSIVQFVDFGSKLVIEGYGVYKSDKGAPQEALDVQLATERLDELSGRLVASVRRAKTREEIALFDLANECGNLARELRDLLEQLKVTSSGAFKTWDSLQKTIKRHLKASEIERLQQRLNKTQQDLSIHLLALLRNDQSDLLVQLRALEANSRRLHFAQLERIDMRSIELQSALQKQNNAVAALFAEVRLTNEQHFATMRGYEVALRALGDQLLATQRIAAVISTSKRILDSLAFEYMEDRRAQIRREHPKTFSWIFNQSLTPFKAWLENDDGTFWISGKAGSGKSTLMKYLVRQPQTESLLKKWTGSGGRDLVMASFYFWNSGNDMQRSQKGLLQSLLYQTFSQCPDIIQLATPHERWHADDSFDTSPEPWEIDELLEAIRNVAANGDALSKMFCFFIDGLDEYSGDHYTLTEILKSIEQSKVIKLCVSSRPWTVFEEAYGIRPERKIILQHFTRPDMDKYITGVLEDDKRFKGLVAKDLRAWRLVTEIRNRAEGVFLWVFLVVRRLLMLMAESVHVVNSLETLERALDALPTDLDAYFRHMVDTIEEAHRAHTAAIFKLAIYAAPLPLIAFYYLPPVLRDPGCVISAPIEADDEDRDEEMITVITKTINAWCKDLLEVHKTSDANVTKVTEMDYKIDFLHRTVKDFLVTDGDIQKIFSLHLPRDFVEPLTLMRLLLAQIKTLDMKPGALEVFRTFTNIACDFMVFAKHYEVRSKSTAWDLITEFNRVGEHFRRIYNEPERSKRSKISVHGIASHWTNACAMFVPDYMQRSSLGDCSLLAFAVMFDLQNIVRHWLTKGHDRDLILAGARGAAILNHALHPLAHHHSLMANRAPSYDMVLLLLEGMPDPESVLNRDFHDTTPWQQFLRRCYCERQPSLWPIARLLLTFKANRHAQILEGGGRKKMVRHTAYSVLDGPDYITAMQCLSGCCPSDQIPELKQILGIEGEQSKVHDELANIALRKKVRFWWRGFT